MVNAGQTNGGGGGNVRCVCVCDARARLCKSVILYAFLPCAYQ